MYNTTSKKLRYCLNLDMLLQFGSMYQQKEKYVTHGVKLITTLVNLQLSEKIRLYQVNKAGKMTVSS